MTIRAARFLSVPPWDLADQPIFWREAAYEAEAAEREARQMIEEKAAEGVRF